MNSETVQPRLIFMAEAQGAALLALLHTSGVIETIIRQGYAVALGLPEFNDAAVQVARLLNAYEIPLVAWLILPDGSAFNAQNYPQAVDRYRAFREWAVTHDLRFEAIGLEIAPPLDVVRIEHDRVRYIINRLRLARENALYFPARMAYAELIAAMRQDGYEVHAYQIPFIADDRRAGTTLTQRTLEIVDLPADLDVLMCASSVSIGRLGGDLGGALIVNYGPDADAISIGSVHAAAAASEEDGMLAWPALRRDLLLAAQHTDTIYVDSLEGCIEQGLLPQIAALDWSAPAHPDRSRVMLIALLRWLIFAALLCARFGLRLLAWAGWVLAVIFWLRARRAKSRRWPRR